MSERSLAHFRQHFPIIAKAIIDRPVNKQSLIYFDNAATTQKPATMIEAYQDYHLHFNANVHRASHALSAKATTSFEQSRNSVKQWLNAAKIEEIIWTTGTTESINIVAHCWGLRHLKTNDEIVLSYSEHHANIVPWQMVAEQTGAIIKVMPLNKQGIIDISQLEQVINHKTKIVCCSHISNVIGKINPIEQVIKRAKQFKALTLIDGAQAVAHLPVDVQALDCDFYVFSAHKMYGPTGVGVLYGRYQLLNDFPPYQGGGEMIETVSFEKTTYNNLPFKLEAGTPNIAGVIAFKQSLQFIAQQNISQLLHYEQRLVDYCYQQLSTISNLHFIVKNKPDIAIFSFIITDIHHHDIATALDSVGIAVRAGHHCAMPLMTYLDIDGCIRISLAPYNTFDEVDVLIESLNNIVESTLLTDNVADKETDKTAGKLAQPNLSATVTDNSGKITNSNAQHIISTDIKCAELSLHDIKQRFAKAKSWDSKHREIMLFGKNHIGIASHHKQAENLIKGCESQAWLIFHCNSEGKYIFAGDSQAKVIRGLLTLVLAAVNNKTAADIHAFDMSAYFDELGLKQHLSPSRSNGLNAIVSKIYSIIN